MNTFFIWAQREAWLILHSGVPGLRDSFPEEVTFDVTLERSFILWIPWMANFWQFSLRGFLFFYFFPLPFLLLWARATSSHIYVQNSSPSCYHTGPPKMLPILSLFNVALLCGSLLLLIPLTCISGPPKDGKIYILFNSQVSPWLDKAVPHRYWIYFCCFFFAYIVSHTLSYSHHIILQIPSEMLLIHDASFAYSSW